MRRFPAAIPPSQDALPFEAGTMKLLAAGLAVKRRQCGSLWLGLVARLKADQICR
jgi:hypothetical protein